MGYFKNEIVNDQEQVDRLVAWYRFHRDKLPESYMQWLLGQDELLWASIKDWEERPYPPVPASAHVANRDWARVERLDRRTRRWWIGWGLVATFVTAAALVFIFGEVSL